MNDNNAESGWGCATQNDDEGGWSNSDNNYESNNSPNNYNRNQNSNNQFQDDNNYNKPNYGHSNNRSQDDSSYNDNYNNSGHDQQYSLNDSNGSFNRSREGNDQSRRDNGRGRGASGGWNNSGRENNAEGNGRRERDSSGRDYNNGGRNQQHSLNDSDGSFNNSEHGFKNDRNDYEGRKGNDQNRRGNGRGRGTNGGRDYNNGGHDQQYSLNDSDGSFNNSEHDFKNDKNNYEGRRGNDQSRRGNERGRGRGAYGGRENNSEGNGRRGKDYNNSGHDQQNSLNDSDGSFNNGNGRRGGDNSGNDYSKRDDSERENNAEGDENNSEGAEAVKKIEFYIPPELGNEESVVFNSGITTGINFEKFDFIKVDMDGNNLPKVISSFEDVNFRTLLMNNIKKSNYTKPTPIQKYALSIVMAERDLMACAQTGSGKTAAFLLPIINSILENPTDVIVDESHVEPHAIILSPTRELAIQIYQEARKFSYDSDIKISLVYGGASTNYQRRGMDKGCHIMIATPGRMLDFVNKGWVTFSSIKFVVLDEADRMLSMGFLPSMQEMFEHPTMVPTEQRRTLMFSATFPQEVQTLAAQFLHDYIFVTVGIIGCASSDVDQVFIRVEQSEKRPKLLEVLNEFGTSGTLIFVGTKRSADFLAIYLSEQGYKINSIHGDRTQREREQAIRDFKTGICDILVATSVAARGLDIPNVRHVINFDLPVSDLDEYVHRIGRTGRIGNKGMATSFFDMEVNSRNAENYTKILEQAEQNVPDWLRSDNRRKDFNRSKPSFGGRDMRQNNQRQNHREETEENEMW